MRTPPVVGELDAKPKNELIASACVLFVSTVLAATKAYVPNVRTRLVIITTSYDAATGYYSAGHVGSPIGDFPVFALCVAVSACNTLLDATAACASPDTRWKRIGEAVAAAFGAVATYAILGGVTFVSALLVLVLTFTSALSDSFFVLALSLVATLWDAAFVSAPCELERTLLALSYAGYAVALEATRSTQPLNMGILLAWRLSTLWLSYATLSGLVQPPAQRTIAYVAAFVPLACVCALGAYMNHTKEVALAPHRKGKHIHPRRVSQGPPGIAVRV